MPQCSGQTEKVVAVPREGIKRERAECISYAVEQDLGFACAFFIVCGKKLCGQRSRLPAIHHANHKRDKRARQGTNNES